MNAQVPSIPRNYSEAVPADFVDLKKYPILDRSGSVYRSIVAGAQAELRRVGACILPGFLKKQYVDEFADEAKALAPAAFHNALVGNAYLEPTDDSLPPSHPRRMEEPTALGAVAYDQFPRGSGIRAIYEWDGLLSFIQDILNRGTLYRYADKMGALNLAVMRDGDYLRWHFDQTDFVSSLALQSAAEGGLYEYVPMIRSKENENYDQVAALLRGNRTGVITLPTEPGTLILFEGRQSIHRVTEIRGQRDRLMILFGFDNKPGVESSDHLRKIRYGRSN